MTLIPLLSFFLAGVELRLGLQHMQFLIEIQNRYFQLIQYVMFIFDTVIHTNSGFVSLCMESIYQSSVICRQMCIAICLHSKLPFFCFSGIWNEFETIITLFFKKDYWLAKWNLESLMILFCYFQIMPHSSCVSLHKSSTVARNGTSVGKADTLNLRVVGSSPTLGIQKSSTVARNGV